MITRWLIRHRDIAGTGWLRQLTLQRTQRGNAVDLVRARRKLAFWDTLLDAWTRNGTRRV